jgi:glycosyltransferase involved in cell wall biosynthesis
MKVSLIIAVYKDVEALELILDSCSQQSYADFEVIVAEDGESKEMKEFITLARQKYTFEILHTTQEDNGVQKSRSQNNGIRASRGEYLIFIDGDCLLYSNFIENHLALSAENNIVTGRRVNLGQTFSQQLRNKEISAAWLEKNFVRKYFKIKEDAKTERHSEEGFQIEPYGLLHKLMIKNRKKRFPMLGCNMSMYKQRMLDINGFDEGLGNASAASDTDLEWRFEGIGCQIIPARFIANEFHLYHKRSPQDYDRDAVDQMFKNQQNRIYLCTNGINKL